MKILDLIGQRFGKLVVIELTSERQGGQVVWKCLCDCGNETFVRSANLRRQHSESCGCGRIKLSEGEAAKRTLLSM